jgi:thioredoxin reductase
MKKPRRTTRRQFLQQSNVAFAVLSAPVVPLYRSESNLMESPMESQAEVQNCEVVIIGGSYAGLSAAMSLGRSLRQVLVVDSGKPCNRQTPHSHNLITHDGATPQEIAEKAKAQVLKYGTVRWQNGIAVQAKQIPTGFEIKTESGGLFRAKKLLLATGVTDIMPDIPGFAECWGISVLHCPYCHGYEVKQQNIGLIGNGEVGFELCRLLYQWSKKLTLFTNGKSTLTAEQHEKLKARQISVVEKDIAHIEHNRGYIREIVLGDGSKTPVSAVFARVRFKQHCDIPQQLGCGMSEMGHIKVNDFQKTDIPGVFAAGDSTTPFRAVSFAMASGTKAGSFINKELIDEAF